MSLTLSANQRRVVSPSRHRSSTSPRGALVAGFIVVAITFGGFGGWAALTPLARGAHAAGRVVVDTNRKSIQHLEGGIIQKILVSEGQFVEAGDPLIELDPLPSRTQERILFSRFTSASLKEARLIAELKKSKSVEVPSVLADHSDDPRVQAAYDNQLELFEARRDEITRQIAILEEQVRQYELQVAGMEAEQVANRDQLRLIREELTGLRELAEKGLVALPRVRALDRERSRLEGEYAARETEIARANVAAGEIQLQILKVTRDREREILAELGDVRSELTEIREQLKSARDALKRTVLIAPVGGQVIELMVHTIGGVVRAGERILDIVPRGERLIVEARVRPLDADTVRAGQPAHVVFTGLPKRTAPHLSARVMSISSDAVTDPQTGEEYFLARVRIDDADMAHISEANIVSGMPADVLIRAGERTLLGYLIAPWVELFGKAMHEY